MIIDLSYESPDGTINELCWQFKDSYLTHHYHILWVEK